MLPAQTTLLSDGIPYKEMLRNSLLAMNGSNTRFRKGCVFENTSILERYPCESGGVPIPSGICCTYVVCTSSCHWLDSQPNYLQRKLTTKFGGQKSLNTIHDSLSSGTHLPRGLTAITSRSVIGEQAMSE